MADTLPVDGRRMRSVRSRAAVVEAFVGLLRNGHDRPSPEAVASESGVSVRSIFRHFEDLDSLHAAAVLTVIDRALDGFANDVPAAGKLGDRVDQLVDARGRLFEALSPVASLASGLADNEEVRAGLGRLNARLKAQAAAAFDGEFKKAGTTKKDAVDGVEAAMGWSAWTNMRGPLGMSAARARRVGARLVNGALRG